MSNSKKISELQEVNNENDYNNSYFVIENNDTNNKVSYKTLKKNLQSGNTITTYTPSSFNDFQTLGTNGTKALTANGGKIITDEVNTKIPLNKTTNTNVSTPLTFNGKI
jgi:hypothetical protein